MPKARGSSAVGAARDKGAILSRERGPVKIYAQIYLQAPAE